MFLKLVRDELLIPRAPLTVNTVHSVPANINAVCEEYELWIRLYVGTSSVNIEWNHFVECVEVSLRTADLDEGRHSSPSAARLR